MFSPLYQRAAAQLTGLALAAGLLAGPLHVHTHKQGEECGHAHLGVHYHSHLHGHHHLAGHDHHHGETCDQEEKSSQQPAPTQHDHDDCTICRFLGQSSLSITVECDSAEAPHLELVLLASPQCESVLLPRLYCGRAPPQQTV